MSKTTDNEIDYQVGQHIVRARSYEEACAKLDNAYFGTTQPSPAAVEQALAEEKANQEKIGATVQAARASAIQPDTKDVDAALARQKAYTQKNYAEMQLAIAQREESKSLFQPQPPPEILWREKANALQAQRDELLAALDAIVSQEYDEHADIQSVSCEIAREAIKGNTLSQDINAAIARATKGGTGQ